MRFLAPVLSLCLTLAVAAPARAIDSVILDLIGRWLADTPEMKEVFDLHQRARNLAAYRKRAEKGDAEANFRLFVSYRRDPRDGAGPRVSTETLVSRAEAEAGLRKAAEAGLPEAISALGRGLFFGGMVKRDPAEAKKWLERALVEGPEGSRLAAGTILGEILLLSPDSTEEERMRGLALTEEALARNFPYAIRVKARALREGLGLDSNPQEARRILEEAVAAGNGLVHAPLGDMLVKGEGGPAEPARGLELLASDAQAADGMGRAILAGLHLDGEIVPRLPRKAIALLTDHALFDLATRQKLAELLLIYGGNVNRQAELGFAYQEDEDVGEADAAWVLLRLSGSAGTPFRDDKLFFDVLERRAEEDDRVGLAWARQRAVFSTRGSAAAGDFARQSRNRIAASIEKGMAAAHTLKGELLRKGWAYAQDDVAATESFRQAAEMGDVEGMVALAEAYDGGLGIDESPDERLKWLRQAAALGSVPARVALVRQFRFDVFERKMTLREGITEAVALYGDGLGSVNALDLSGLFRNRRLDDFGPDEVARAFMDGFRAAPAGLEEDLLVPVGRNLERDNLAAIEAVLKADGFHAGETEGHFRPDAREALRAWVVAKGPLPPHEIPAEAKPPVGPAFPDIPLEVIVKAHDVAFERAFAATNDAEVAAAMKMLVSVARVGEPDARWALLRNYHRSALVRAAVTAEEISRYGLDLIITNHPGMDKLEMEFTFSMAQLYQDGESEAFAAGFLATLRDDARLRDKPTLGAVLGTLLFVPGACDALIEGAAKAGARTLPADGGCDDRTTRDALVAYAEEAGPSGIEAEVRAAAVGDVYEIAGAAP